MANNIEAAELIESENEKLRELISSQEKIAKTLNDGSLDNVILATKNTLRTNEETVKIIRDSLSE